MQVRMSWQWRAMIDLRDGVWRQKCVDTWCNTGLQEVKNVVPCSVSRPLGVSVNDRRSMSKIEQTLDQAFGRGF